MKLSYAVAVFASSVGWASAADLIVPMTVVDAQGTGAAFGSIKVSQTPQGVAFTPALTGLPVGEHGFHLHENPSCAPKEKEGKMTAALAAGGHYDPSTTKKHEGPDGNGHLGDLPKLLVADDGRATHAVSAPRLKLSDVKGRALVIHSGGDNYSDDPEPLGGGKARIACGVVPAE